MLSTTCDKKSFLLVNIYGKLVVSGWLQFYLARESKIGEWVYIPFKDLWNFLATISKIRDNFEECEE